MIIQESDFKLTPIADDCPFFDLELLYTIRPKGKEARQEFKISGYGMSLETALKRIAHFRVCNKHTTNAIQIKQYLEDYKKEIESLKTLL